MTTVLELDLELWGQISDSNKLP
ncbi:MAG: hypothetical protein UX67_C0047G0001, partial [Candidatus Woesebacteria bacterium GW2011_GWF2_46_8]